MAFPWLPLLTAFGPGILQMLLGGNKPQEQKQLTTTTQDPTGDQSPLLGLLDPFMMESLLGRIQQFSGAGMPGGVSGGTSPALNDILNLLGGEWEGLLEGYKGLDGPSKPRRGTTLPETQPPAIFR